MSRTFTGDSHDRTKPAPGIATLVTSVVVAAAAQGIVEGHH
jgi:hypothetical protein